MHAKTERAYSHDGTVTYYNIRLNPYNSIIGYYNNLYENMMQLLLHLIEKPNRYYMSENRKNIKLQSNIMKAISGDFNINFFG